MAAPAIQPDHPDDLDADLRVVRGLIAQRYGQDPVTVERHVPGHPVFRVTTQTGVWAVRVGPSLHGYAAALDVLERVGYPAPRVVADLAGQPVVRVELDGNDSEVGEVREAMVVAWVHGASTTFEPSALAALGAALGRLHRLGAPALTAAADPRPGLPPVERAAMLPANELRFALRNLVSVADLVSDAERAEWTRLVAECERGLDVGTGLTGLTGLTEVFLHGDAHPQNSVQTANGSAVLVDWDSAGAGPAVIDLGFLAVSCDTGLLDGPLAPPDPARLQAVVEAYGREMTLTDADLDALEDAVAFRVLVCAGVGVGTLIRLGRRPLQEPGVQWSLDRLAAAPDTARRIRQHLVHPIAVGSVGCGWLRRDELGETN